MIVGPIFTRELVTAPRRPQLFIYRAMYATALLVLMGTAWLMVFGSQVVRGVGDLARFGAILFQVLTPLQLAVVLFFSALLSASAVAQEKDRRTMLLLLMTRLTNSELVLGRLLASLLIVLTMVAAGLPVFMLTSLLGGVSTEQVLRVFAVTVITALAAGSLGSTIAFWREKTFQTLALTALILVFWLGAWEAVAAGAFGKQWGRWTAVQVATIASPLRAVMAAASPFAAQAIDAEKSELGAPEAKASTEASGEAVRATAIGLGNADWWSHPTVAYCLFSLTLSVTLSGLAIARLRVWNPSRQVLDKGPEMTERGEGLWGPGETGNADRAAIAATARASHVDAGKAYSGQPGSSRTVWHNPILWREVCTWAYGRKVVVIRVTYWILFAITLVALQWVRQGVGEQDAPGLAGFVAPAARPLIPFFLVSLGIMNALAVSAITSERDAKSLDLLLVTDLSPKEFIFGKLGGVLWLAKDMILLPILGLLVAYFTDRTRLFQTEHVWFVVIGLGVMYIFVSILGMHCGIIYADSRTAIAVSLGTVFFLFLGVMTCLLIMVSFSTSFEKQWGAFSAFILGGSVGLYVALGIRNRSPAMALACFLLPFATFYAITSFLLGLNMAVFLAMSATYSFATAAMMIPALAQFDFAMGRSSAVDE